MNTQYSDNVSTIALNMLSMGFVGIHDAEWFQEVIPKVLARINLTRTTAVKNWLMIYFYINKCPEHITALEVKCRCLKLYKI